MATSVVPRGKLEVCDREGKEILPGWAVDENGVVSTDAGKVLKNLMGRLGGGLLPLGGAGEEMSGHKGFGLALLVDILSGVLSGAAFSDGVYPSGGEVKPPNIGHFFAAVSIKGFRDPAEFKADMDLLLGKIKNSRKAEGRERIYIHGEKEFENMEVNLKEGVPIHDSTFEMIKKIAGKTGIEVTFCK